MHYRYSIAVTKWYCMPIFYILDNNLYVEKIWLNYMYKLKLQDSKLKGSIYISFCNSFILQIGIWGSRVLVLCKRSSNYSRNEAEVEPTCFDESHVSLLESEGFNANSTTYNFINFGEVIKTPRASIVLFVNWGWLLINVL